MRWPAASPSDVRHQPASTARPPSPVSPPLTPCPRPPIPSLVGHHEALRRPHPFHQRRLGLDCHLATWTHLLPPHGPALCEPHSLLAKSAPPKTTYSSTCLPRKPNARPVRRLSSTSRRPSSSSTLATARPADFSLTDPAWARASSAISLPAVPYRHVSKSRAGQSTKMVIFFSTSKICLPTPTPTTAGLYGSSRTTPNPVVTKAAWASFPALFRTRSLSPANTSNSSGVCKAAGWDRTRHGKFSAMDGGIG